MYFFICSGLNTPLYLLMYVESNYRYYWDCNIHMSPVGRSVCHNFLKGREEYISMLKKIGGKDG